VNKYLDYQVVAEQTLPGTVLVVSTLLVHKYGPRLARQFDDTIFEFLTGAIIEINASAHSDTA
jgi:hypothetical protein